MTTFDHYVGNYNILEFQSIWRGFCFHWFFAGCFAIWQIFTFKFANFRILWSIIFKKYIYSHRLTCYFSTKAMKKKHVIFRFNCIFSYTINSIRSKYSITYKQTEMSKNNITSTHWTFKHTRISAQRMKKHKRQIRIVYYANFSLQRGTPNFYSLNYRLKSYNCFSTKNSMIAFISVRNGISLKKYKIKK